MNLRVLCSTILVVVCVFGSLSGGARSSSLSSSPSLTNKGQLLWNLEGLLRRSFPGQQVVSAVLEKGATLNFACGGLCTPLSKFEPYWFMFQSPGGSSFRLIGRKVASGIYGNYPLLILIKGHAVACRSGGRSVLVGYSDAAGLALACVHAG